MNRCGTCGAENIEGNSFCGNCGTRLSKDVRSTEPSGKRRHLTVMFCDLVGSTGLAERLDPEDWLEVLRICQRSCGDTIN